MNRQLYAVIELTPTGKVKDYISARILHDGESPDDYFFEAVNGHFTYEPGFVYVSNKNQYYSLFYENPEPGFSGLYKEVNHRFKKLEIIRGAAYFNGAKIAGLFKMIPQSMLY